MIANLIDLIPYRYRDKIRRIPLVGSLQRRIFQTAFRGEFDFIVKEGPARGLVFPLRLPDDKLFWTGLWEREFAESLAGATRRGAVCLDVGAHRGYFSGVMAVNGAAEVHCFEPNPDNIAKLQRLAELNPDLPLKVHALALGDTDGEQEFVLMAEDTMGKLASSGFQSARESSTRFGVRCAKLDTLISSQRVPAPHVLKIDVEGGEMMVLLGGMQTIRTAGPDIFLEYHSGDLARGCARLLQDLGYNIKWMEASDAANLPDSAVGHFAAVRP